jgi:hypothetical protein
VLIDAREINIFLTDLHEQINEVLCFGKLVPCDTFTIVMIKCRIFAFGNAGLSIINELMMGKTDPQQLFYQDTDIDSLKKCSLPNKFLIGKELLKGKGSRGSVRKARDAFHQDIELFKRLITEDVVYFLVGGFGGGTFTAMVVEMSRILQEMNRQLMVIATFPFIDEGKKVTRKAYNAISALNAFTDHLILINDRGAVYNLADQGFQEVHRQMNLTVVDILQELSDDPHRNTKRARRHFPKVEEAIGLAKEWLVTGKYLVTEKSEYILPKVNKQLLAAITVDPRFVHIISPRKFEELVEEVFRLAGNRTELTSATRDDGADLLVWTPPPIMGNEFLTIIQTKQYNPLHKVSSEEVRTLKGTQLTFEAEKAQIITTSDFSKPAITTAKKIKIDLIRFYELNDTIKKVIQ